LELPETDGKHAQSSASGMTGKMGMRPLNVYWVIHNFVRTHFTTKEVPAVTLGVIKNGLTVKTLFSTQYV